MLKWQLILMVMLILALCYMDCGVAIDPRGEQRVIHPEEIVDQVKVGLSVNYGHAYADVDLTPPWEPMSIDHAVAFRDIIINGSLAADKVAFKREVGIERPTIPGMLASIVLVSMRTFPEMD
jgi:hypothetical protein